VLDGERDTFPAAISRLFAECSDSSELARPLASARWRDPVTSVCSESFRLPLQQTPYEADQHVMPAGTHDVCEHDPAGSRAVAQGSRWVRGDSSTRERGICRARGRLLTWSRRSASSSLACGYAARLPLAGRSGNSQLSVYRASRRFAGLEGHSYLRTGGLSGLARVERRVVTERGRSPGGCREIVEFGTPGVVKVPLGVRGVTCGSWPPE